MTRFWQVLLVQFVYLGEFAKFGLEIFDDLGGEECGATIPLSIRRQPSPRTP